MIVDIVKEILILEITLFKKEGLCKRNLREQKVISHKFLNCLKNFQIKLF